MEELFIKASRKRDFRFISGNGLVTVEDLWNLPLAKVNDIAVAVNKKIKDSTEESFLAKPTAANATLELQLEILKYVINTRQKEADSKKTELVKKQQAENLKELIAKKKGEALEGQSIEELEKQLKDLEG